MSVIPRTMKLTGIALAAALACCALAPGKGEAATLNVPGDYPTIQAGIDAAADGDVVLVSPGTYGESLLVEKNITVASLYHTTGEEGHIAETVIDASGLACAVYVAEGVTLAKIVGFTIRNAEGAGVVGRGTFDFLHNIVTNTRDGVDYAGGGGGVCRFNTFEGQRDDGLDIDDAAAVVVESNSFVDCADDGIELRLHPYDGPEDDDLEIIIRENLFLGSGEDGLQIIDYAGVSHRTITIERNVFDTNAMAGIGVMDGGNTMEDYRAALMIEKAYVINNTFVANDVGLAGGARLLALNNIFLDNAGVAMKMVGGYSLAAHNLFWRNGVAHEGSNVDEASTLYEDPLLDSDYRPAAGSPCVDAGAVSIIWNDEAVIVEAGTYGGVAPDVGAREGDGSGGPWDQTPPSAPSDLQAQAASGWEIQLAWAPAEDSESDVNSYLVYRDGVQVASVAGTETAYADTGLSAATAYSYSVSAVNGAGLEGAASGEAVAATSSPTSADTDGDGLPDHFEVTFGTSPYAPDTDGDGTLDGYEDPDGDGYMNLDEYLRGTDPNDPDSPSGGLDGSAAGMAACAPGVSTTSLPAAAALLGLLAAALAVRRTRSR